MSLLDTVMQHLGAGGVEQIANQIGADPATTQNAIQSAVPAILGGMAGNARQPEGASSIAGALDQAGGLGGLAGMLGGGGGGGGLGGMLGGLLGGGGGGGGGLGGMLGGLLGQHTGTVEQGVQQASGLSGGQTTQLLSMLAPVVLGALASHQAQGGGGGFGGLSNILEQHARETAQASPAAGGGILGRILGSI